jgi:hypothetical protein
LAPVRNVALLLQAPARRSRCESLTAGYAKSDVASELPVRSTWVPITRSRSCVWVPKPVGSANSEMACELPVRLPRRGSVTPPLTVLKATWVL